MSHLLFCQFRFGHTLFTVIVLLLNLTSLYSQGHTSRNKVNNHDRDWQLDGEVPGTFLR